MWLLLAAGSAVSAGLVSVTVKMGMKNVDSNLGTFLRTLVVLVFTFVVVLNAGSLETIKYVKPSEWIFIIASGLCTGVSWLSYFKALQIGDVNKVVPVDKMSTVLTMVLAIVILGEPFWWLTFAAMAIMIAGTMMMISKGRTVTHADKYKETVSFTDGRTGYEITENHKGNWLKANLWFVYALLSLVSASLTSILAKLGMQSVDSNLGTYLRTIVVAVMAFLIVLWKRKFTDINKLTNLNWLFLIISGCLTGVSWLCYYGAIQTGNVSIVVPIDKLSIVAAVIFSYFIFNEKLNLKAFIGLILLTGGTLLLLIKP